MKTCETCAELKEDGSCALHEVGCGPEYDLWIAKQVKGLDNINHPSHYTTGSIETISYIEDKLSPEGLQGYYTGNIIKYVSRYKHKNGIEDLKKAAWYLDRMIKNMEESKC